MLKVSVITPSYNQANFLEETILSIYNQSYRNIQHIIVDGGSTDKSVDIIKKHEDKISYWISEKDKGQSDAINKGFKIANGEIITWINSDDVLLPNALERVVYHFQNNPEIDFLHGKSILFGNDKKEKIIGTFQQDFQHRYLAYIPFPQPSSFFRKKVIDETGGLNTSLHYGMDYELLVRVALNFELMFVDEVFSKYRLHKAAKTNDPIGFCKDWSIVFSKLLRTFDLHGEFIRLYTELGFYQSGTEIYISRKQLSEEQLKTIFLYHLLILFHYHYNACEMLQVKKIGALIHSLDKSFYLTNKLNKEISKIKYLNPSLIKILRNIKEKIVN